MEALLYIAIPAAIAVGIYLGIKARKRAKANAGMAGGLIERDGFGFDGDNGGGGGNGGD